MKKHTTVAVAWTVLTLAGFAPAQEEAATLEAGLDLPVLSGYVWRGQVLNDEAVVQPSLTVAKGGFSLNTWANYNLTDNVTGDADFNEVDLTVAYDFSVGPASYSVGVVEYLFPNTTFSGTREVYVGASLDDLPVTPAAMVYYDFDEADGAYFTVSLGYSHALSDALALDVSGSIGYGLSDYNEFYFGVADDALNDGNVSLSLTYAVNDAWSVSPAVAYSALLDNDIKDAAKELYFDDSEVVASVTASYAF